MHLTRPKSSKGRSRPPVDGSFYAADTDYSSQRSSDSPSYFSRPDRNLRSQSQPIMWQTGHLSQDEVLQMLQQAPAAPPQSLNKYTVLPSIERRHSEVRGLERQMSHHNLSDYEGPHPPSIPERDPEPPPDPAPQGNRDSGPFGSLLLAIRAPCGRRFQQQFDPADNLLKVKASAEVRYGVQYGEASIETMDVPRRTFTDMEMTLAQCGIINKSVLCISYNVSEGEKR